MKKLALALMAVGLLPAAASLLDTNEVFAQTGSSVGSLRGTINDKATKEAAIGATVVATSPSLQGEQVAITEDGGQYFITSLPPGLYTLTVYYNDATFSRGNVLIQVGKEAVVNVTVDSGATAGKPKGEVITIQGTAPIVDQGSTKTGLSITEDYTRNIPTARTFGGTISATAGSTKDFFGANFSGATSLENTYIIEGINTTDTSNGALSSNLPNEFLQETEIITGGYNAEYGRATGGIVNVVTKGGSNEFHGSVYGYYSPGGLVADAQRIVREGQSIDSESKLNYSYDVGGEVGGPIIKDKLWFHVGFNPSIRRLNEARIVNQQIDKNQDGVPDTDANGAPLLEQVNRQTLVDKQNTYYFTAKINGAINQNNQFSVSFTGNPETRDAPSTNLLRPADQTVFGDNTGAYDLSAKYTSKLNEGKTQIDVVAGYHKGYEDQSPLTAGQNQALVRYNYERSLYDFADLEGTNSIAACQDGGPGDKYQMIRNCPVSQYTESGLGTLEKRDNNRTSITASLTQRVKAAGYHTFKVGGDAEISTYNANRYLTGGQYLLRLSCNELPSGACDDSGMDPAAVPGAWIGYQNLQEERKLTPAEIAALADGDPSNDPTLAAGQIICAGGGSICNRAQNLIANTTNRSLAAYVSDSWQIRPNFTVNLGIRYEQQVGYVADKLKGTQTPSVEAGYNEMYPDRAYSLDNLWAPRIGFVYDPTNDGKAKIFGHWGRFYENVPMRLNVRAFGGEIQSQEVINGGGLTPADAGYNPNCNVDHGTPNLASALDMCADRQTQAIYGQGVESTTKGTKGQYSQEFVLGSEYEILPDIKLGLNWIHRSMPSVLEDVLSPTGEYILTNPGQNFDSYAADLDQQAEVFLNKVDTNGDGEISSAERAADPADAGHYDLLSSRADTTRRIKTYDKPDRRYDGIQITANQRPTSKSLINASYTYSRTRGNYPGLFIPETNQDDPNLTAQFDQPSLSANRFGLLSLDRTHNFKLDAFYLFDFKKHGVLTTGGSFRVASGVPHSTLGQDYLYGEDEVYILKRGTSARGPVTSQLDVHLAYGYNLAKDRRIEVFTNIFNLFDQQDETNRDDSYTFDFVLPIINGDQEDLKHLKTLDGNGAEVNTTATKNKNYGRLSERQSSRSVQFGARLTF
ncbi:MAG TPA: TonB-dependent receptor [Kofleriaceae bacterium]|jgi:hypothetical protein